MLVYRLLELTLRDTLTGRYGADETSSILREAGTVAGAEFCRSVLDASLPLDDFLALLQRTLRQLSIGVLHIERSDPDTLEFVLTVAEDLGCSGLPVTGEMVCDYDEGFIAGVLHAYFRRESVAREVDCRASGGRICRFAVRPLTAELVTA